MAVSFLVDATNYVHTYFAGTGGQYNAVTALRNLVACYHRQHAQHVALCFDAPGKTFRHQLYPPYKATRGAKDPALVQQLVDAVEYAECEGIAYPRHAGYEADDLIAMATMERLTAGDQVVICSRDKDLRQLLVPGHVTILRRASQHRGEWSFEYFTAKDLERETGLHPAQWADYRTLVGDPSDNWPGCPGIGETTAQAILHRAKTLDNALANIWSLPINSKQRDALLRFDWKLGRKLMTLASLPARQVA